MRPIGLLLLLALPLALALTPKEPQGAWRCTIQCQEQLAGRRGMRRATAVAGAPNCRVGAAQRSRLASEPPAGLPR